MITQAQLDAGGRAVMKMASDSGFGSYINFDQARALAAAVLKADREVTHAAKNGNPPPVPSVPVPDNSLNDMLGHAAEWFKGVGSALVGKKPNK